MSNFHFLFEEFSALGRAAKEAERQVYFSPTASCAFSRKALEMALRWMIANDPDLEVPDDSSLHHLLTGGDLARLLRPARCKELDVVRRMGNEGLHEGWLEESQAKISLRYVHGLLTWIYQSYAQLHEYEVPLPPFEEENIPWLGESSDLEGTRHYHPGSSSAVKPMYAEADFQDLPFSESAEDSFEEWSGIKRLSAMERKADDDGVDSYGSDKMDASNHNWFHKLCAALSDWVRRIRRGRVELHSDNKLAFRRKWGSDGIGEVGVPSVSAKMRWSKRNDLGLDTGFELGFDIGVSGIERPVEPYRRKGNVLSTRTFGVSEESTQAVFIETLMREAGWGAQLDQQEKHRIRPGIGSQQDAPFSPLWLAELYSVHGVPELLIADAMELSKSESPLRTLRSALEALLSDGQEFEGDAFYSDHSGRVWLSNVAVYLLDGIQIKRYDYDKDEVTLVEGVQPRFEV